MVKFGASWEVHGRRDMTKKQADLAAKKIRIESGCEAHAVCVGKGARAEKSAQPTTPVVAAPIGAKKGRRG